MTFRYAVAAVAAVALSAAVLAQGPRRDGRWEITTEMDMPGMPMKMPAMKTTQCITARDAADPQRSLPQANAGRGGRGDNGNCTVSDYKQDGNKVSWTMKCTGPQAMSGTGEIVYGADTYDGTMKMDMGGQTMTMKYSGKRLGDCTQ